MRAMDGKKEKKKKMIVFFRRVLSLVTPEVWEAESSFYSRISFSVLPFVDEKMFVLLAYTTA